MKKTYILIIISLIAVFNISAQNIELPEVTTVIQGESIKAEKDALPDFNDVLEIPNGSGKIVPELPDINIDLEDENKIENKNKDEKSKSLFSEISAGGGYPFLFFGNCEISSTDKLNPFKLVFNYESANGYKSRSLTDNFSDSNIDLFVDKSFYKNNLFLDFAIDYSLHSNGLQKLATNMSLINNSLVSGKGKVEYSFNNGITAGAHLKLDLYNRFGNISALNSTAAGDGSGNGTADLEKWTRESAFLSFNPVIYSKWSGYGFDVLLSGSYFLDGNLINNISGGSINRGQINGDVKWHNDIVSAFCNIGIVFGNQLRNNSVLIPFTLGTDIVFPVYFSNRKFRIGAEGGLESNYNSVGSLENKYSFAALSSVPAETADWFGKLEIDIPLKTSFTGNIVAEYRESAFNNGIWEADYSDDSFTNGSGIYGFRHIDRRSFATDLTMTYHHNLFSIKGGWHANWLNVPSNSSMQQITLNFLIQDKNSKWGADIFGAYNVTKTWQLPILNLEGFYQISPTVRLNASLCDVLNLFTKDLRIENGKYAGRGFSGAIFLKVIL